MLSPPGAYQAAFMLHFCPVMAAVFSSIYALVCLGAGLSVLVGLRAFMPIAFFALYSRLEFASAPSLDGTPFAFLEKGWVLALFFALAAVDLSLDKILTWAPNPAFARYRDRVTQVVKIVVGGVAFAAAVASQHWIAMTVCAVLGLVIAGLADHVRRALRPDASVVGKGPVLLMSIYEDGAVLIGTLLFVLVPFVGALVAVFAFLLAYRLQQRRRRKHKGLRILKG